MSLKTKRLIFGILFSFFFLYTIAVDTIGTSKDDGERWLTEKAKKGKLVFQEYNCTACHQIYGLGGYMGPDLTNVISTPGKGPIYAKAFLQAGSQRMPNFQLSEEKMEELIEFLTYIDKTGISPVKKFKTNFDGTISEATK
ncbi:MAG: cytochrome c [Bacteroidetes bacterium]|nr:cytochrome c [Bacteroidota bacterium]